jgi:hypothetical protein
MNWSPPPSTLDPAPANRRWLLMGLVLLSVVFVAAPARAQTPPPTEVADRVPLRLAIQTEAAFGVGTGTFYNQLVGGRLDLTFSPHVSLGGYVGYANLKGKDGRASSTLTYAQLEYMAGDPANAVRFPVRFATGYLGGNGPVVRATAGLAFRLSPSVDVVTELLAPMVWLTNAQTLLSLDLSLELAVRL